MKKVVAIVLTVLMTAVLFAGCSKKDNDTPKVTTAPTSEPTQAPTTAPTEAPEPAEEAPTEAPAVVIAPDTKYNAFEQFDMESATGENVPWVYSYSIDAGLTYEPLTVMEATDTLFPWHPWAGSWVGVGLNNDVPNLVELNTDYKDGINGALGFKAPTDGSYVITGYVMNPWDQTADLLYCRLNGNDLFTVQPGVSTDGAVVFPQTTVDLKAGDVVYFFCPSTDSWVSAYVEVNFYYEPTSVPELVLPEVPAE